MDVFVAALRAEILKSRNSFAVWLSVLGTIGNMIIFFLINWFNFGPHLFGGEASDWEVYILNHYEGIAFMMLPLYVIILATLLTFMEHRSGTWALLMSLPSSRATVYSAKLAFGLLLFIAAHLFFVMGLFLSGLLTSLLHPELSMPIPAFPVKIIAILAIKTVFSIIALLGLHFWISLRFRHFIIPLTIGILGFVFTSILSPAFPYQWLNPYAFPICYMPAQLEMIELPSVGFWNLHDGMSMLWGLLFWCLGVWEVQRAAF